MEDTIDICMGCGKLPRSIDYRDGTFTCTRCGGKMLSSVTASEYEQKVHELDALFHSRLIKAKHEMAASEPIVLVKKSSKVSQKAKIGIRGGKAKPKKSKKVVKRGKR